MNRSNDFGVLIGLAYQQLVSELHARLAEAGFDHIRQNFGYAFKMLAEESLTTSQLAARLQVTHQGAAKVVDEMVATGYVERVPDPGDGRVKRLVLTERCHSLMAIAQEFHREYELRLVEELGAEKLVAVREVLNAIVDRSDSADGLARTLRPLP